MELSVQNQFIPISFLLDIPFEGGVSGTSQLFVSKPEMSLHLAGDDYEFFSWGDPIVTDKFRNELHIHRSIQFIVNNLYGHYWYLFIDKTKNEFQAGNSLFSILPVYYFAGKGRIILSDNALSLGRHAGTADISKQFILESVLFNYPLFGNSALNGISLLPSNSGIIAGRHGFNVVKHTSVAELFTEKPSPFRKSAERLTDHFLSTSAKYFPEENYYCSLTGGFDSRTLTAAGKYHGKGFSCYCFGSSVSKDVDIASGVSSGAAVPLETIALDDDFVKGHSLDSGRQFIINSSGTGTFSRSHYVYAASHLAERSKYLISGNFGSELFRAVHIPGVVISQNLYAVFRSSNPEDALRILKRSKEAEHLNQENYDLEWKALLNDMQHLPCFNVGYKDLTLNMQFYVFVFEELFRKYFGAELSNQFIYLKNRTPFLDIDFIRELLKTRFAGIHSEFFEQNPIKRYKGQLLYAHIIRKAFPELGYLKTDKGYSPSDLLTNRGKLNILKGYLEKRWRSTDSQYDPNGVKQSWHHNHLFYESLPLDASLFHEEHLKASSGDRFTDLKARIYSLIFLNNYLKQV